MDNLKTRLLERFGKGVEAPMSDDQFNAMALEVFAYQCDGNPVYASYSERHGVTPDTVERWEQIPAVPTRAFKTLRFNAHPEQALEREFKTSGTTQGRAVRGTHPVADLDLYRASLLPNFAAHLLPGWDPSVRMPMVVLALSPEELPESSLSYMLGAVGEELTDSLGYFVTEEAGIEVERLEAVLGEWMSGSMPLLVAGTAFSFVHWLDSLAKRKKKLDLPEGSRIMETGGFKGRSRAVERNELYRALTERLSVPEDHIVNEYGMTELLSQYYEPVLLGRPRMHVGPPWLRTRIVDPATLAPLPDGEPGLIEHFDLANLNSVSAVLTEDVGVLTPEGLELHGRAGRAEPRGCSIAMDALLSVLS